MPLVAAVTTSLISQQQLLLLLSSHLLVLQQGHVAMCIRAWLLLRLQGRRRGENHLRLQAEGQLRVLVPFGQVARRQLLLVLHEEVGLALDQQLAAGTREAREEGTERREARSENKATKW